MFNILIKRANALLEKQEEITKLYIAADKVATPGSCYHSCYLEGQGLTRKITQYFNLKDELREACWDYRLDPDKVVTIAKWLRRHRVSNVPLMTGARLAYTLA